MAERSSKSEAQLEGRRHRAHLGLHPHLPAPLGPPFLPLTTSNSVPLLTMPKSSFPPALATPHIPPEWSDLSQDRTSQTKVL